MNAMTRLFALTTLAGACASAWGNPTGAVVARGAALLSNPSANVLQIVNTPGTVINWQGFSIGATETTRFVQQNAASAVLNRVMGGNPSSILGRLDSNGRVFLINPNGIVFGGGSVVDVAGLIASTRSISDANFAAGNYLFEGGGNGAITMQAGARILTSTYGPGGQVWLFAQNVTQEAGASITAPQGQVVLTAGTQMQVGQSQLGNMTFNVNVAGGETVELLGTIAAERGAVGLFADNIRIRDGANVNVSAAASGNGGSIAAKARTLLEIERLAAVAADGGTAGGNGGTISLTAADVRVSPVANAYGNVHASARASGAQHGTVTLDQTGSPGITQVADTSLAVLGNTLGGIYVSASAMADGSYVVVWSAGGELFAQQVDANGAPIGARSMLAARVTAPGPGRLHEGSQTEPSVAALKGGGYAVVWQTVGDIFSTNMMIVGPSGQTAPIVLYSEPRPVSVAALTDGGFVVAWVDGGGGRVPLVQRFNASGSPLSSVQQVAQVSTSSSFNVRVAGLSDGGYAIYHGGFGGGGTVLQFANGGQLVASSAVPETGSGVSGLVDGGYALATGNFFAASGNLKRFSANGVPVGSTTPFSAAPFLVSPIVSGTADGSVVAVGGAFDWVAAAKDGGHAIAYRSDPNSPTESVNLKILARQAVASSPGATTGEVGLASSFPTAPGVTNEGSSSPIPSPSTSTEPVLGGNPNGHPSFGGVSGCTSAACATEVRGAISAADAMRAASNMKTTASGAIDAAAASRAVDALIEADANRAAVDRLIAGDADRAAAAAARAATDADQRAVDAMIEADANQAEVNRMIAADADQAAIDQLIEQAAQRSQAAAAATAAAARAKAAAAAAEAKANSVKDARTQGGFILIGDAEIGRVLDDRTMTPQQKVAALDRLQQQEIADQQFGTAPDGDRNVEGSRGALARDNLFKSLWVSMSPEERRITVENYDKALRAGGEADLLDSVPDSASRR